MSRRPSRPGLLSPIPRHTSGTEAGVGIALVALLGSGLLLGLATRPAAAQRTPTVAGELRYDGARLSFLVPAGVKVKEGSDVAADHALELSIGPGAALSTTSFVVLLSNARVSEADVEGVASAWRDARLRNRASWGVRAKGERRTEQSQIGSRRFLRFSDQIGSLLGAARQLMLCGAVSGRLVCGVASGPSATEREAEALISHVLETVAVRKKSEAK